MKRFFSTAGPVNPGKHYYIDSLTRIDLDKLMSLVQQEKYFVLHAPRQTGKTTLLRSFMSHLNSGGRYTCLHVNVEKAQAARENVKEGIRAILDTLGEKAFDYLADPFVKKNWRRIVDESGEYAALQNMLKHWAKHNRRPIVLLIDEIDSLVGDTLISVLRQLRSGYEDRPELFPQSIVLCGVRDVRDYRIHSDKEKSLITGGSAFNIKAESLKLGNFTKQEINELYAQHTKETGQEFAEEVFPLVWDLTGGQPWLVNALAYEVCSNMKDGRDRKKKITGDSVKQAKENLILRRETHLDHLADKLSEERVRRVLEPILSDSSAPEKIAEDDLDYVTDLGLVVKEGQVRIANRIYQEVIPRQLTHSTQLTIHQEAPWYTEPDGRLNLDKLLTAFQGFFRGQFESWVDGFDYAEAGPQLLLQAFLQRIVNGGGRVEREYGLGRRRTDLLVNWPYPGGVQQAVLELKIRHGSMDSTIEKGLEQTHDYMDKCGAFEGYLLIFDRRETVSWEEKIFKSERTWNGVKINVYGM